MLAHQSSASLGSGQDISPSNRRPASDMDRVWEAFNMIATGELKPTESQVFAYFFMRCYSEPVMRGESDKLNTVAANSAEVAKACGLDRSNAYRAIKGLESHGLVKIKHGRIWIVMSRVGEIVGASGRTIRPALSVVESTTEPAGAVVNSTTDAHESVVESTTAPAIEPAHARAPARSGLYYSSESQKTDSASEYIYHPGDQGDSGAQEVKIQDDIYIDETTKAPVSDPETDAWIMAFCEAHFPTRHVAESLLSNTRGKYPAAWYRKALKRAVLRRNPRWKYIAEIMETWAGYWMVDEGPEDRYDDDMNPISIKAIPTIPDAPSAPDRPLSRYQQTMASAAAMEANPNWFADAMKLHEARQEKLNKLKGGA